MVRLFEEEAIQRRVRIRMIGHSFRNPDLYDSFESIPLVLIDNAIKYAIPGSEVRVTVDDRDQHCFVSVDSHGEVVSEDDQKRIFLKGFRSASAKKSNSTGSGLGLYIAKIVAKANGFKIHFSATPDGLGKTIGLNSFSFELF
jgi:signal transduction histidine kinase